MTQTEMNRATEPGWIAVTSGCIIHFSAVMMLDSLGQVMFRVLYFLIWESLVLQVRGGPDLVKGRTPIQYHRAPTNQLIWRRLLLPRFSTTAISDPVRNQNDLDDTIWTVAIGQLPTLT